MVERFEIWKRWFVKREIKIKMLLWILLLLLLLMLLLLLVVLFCVVINERLLL